MGERLCLAHRGLPGLHQDCGRILAFPAVCDNSHVPTANPNSATKLTFPTSAPMTSSDVTASYLLPRQKKTAASLRWLRSRGDQRLTTWFMSLVYALPNGPDPDIYTQGSCICPLLVGHFVGCKNRAAEATAVFCKGECIFLCQAGS